MVSVDRTYGNHVDINVIYRDWFTYGEHATFEHPLRSDAVLSKMLEEIT